MPRFEPSGLGKRAEAPAGYTMTIAEEAAMRRLDPRAFAVLAAAAEALAEVEAGLTPDLTDMCRGRLLPPEETTTR